MSSGRVCNMKRLVCCRVWAHKKTTQEASHPVILEGKYLLHLPNSRMWIVSNAKLFSIQPKIRLHKAIGRNSISAWTLKYTWKPNIYEVSLSCMRYQLYSEERNTTYTNKVCCEFVCGKTLILYLKYLPAYCCKAAAVLLEGLSE